MFGPLPQLYRILVVAFAILVFIGGGLWLAHLVDVPLPLGGILGGTGVGALIAYALVHDFSHHAEPRPLRIPRRR